MHSELQSPANTFAFNSRFLEMLVGDFTPANWLVRDAVGHDPRWLLGHITSIRHRLVGMVGLPPITAGWEGAFARGTLPKDLPEDIDPAAIYRSFQEAGQVLAGRWPTLTSADLEKPLGRTMPDGSTTIGPAIRFLAWHETYHLGQLGIFRRLAGKAGAV